MGEEEFVALEEKKSRLGEVIDINNMYGMSFFLHSRHEGLPANIGTMKDGSN